MTSRRTLQGVLAAIAVVLGTAKGKAAEIVEVLPLTDRILMVHFNDGHVVHHTLGQPRSHEPVIGAPLDVVAATTPASYSLQSADDPAYANPTAPLTIGRKSKGTDFSWNIDWDAKNKHVESTKPDHTDEHWIYLTLPEPMVHGKTYTLKTGTLNTKGGNEFKLTYDEAALRSEAVHVNLLGYVPGAPKKFGYVYQWMGDRGSLELKAYEGKPFWLVDQTSGKKVFEGKLAFRKSSLNPETGQMSDTPNGNFLGADVYECDISAFATPGSYALVVEGIGRSFPFKVDADVYREAFRATARALYHNRSGIALTEPYTKFTRPAPQNTKLTPGFKGKLIYTTLRWPDYGGENAPADKLLATSKGALENTWGWYQDAGDWDGYYTHLRVAQELLLAYELVPKNFTDGELNIPESGNGVPDIVDEAAWLPRYCYRLRHELMDKKWGTGGIGLRVAGDSFGTDEKKLPNGEMVGQGSWQDLRTYAVSGEDPWSTYRYAGAAAQLAHALAIAGVKDPEGVDWAKEAAESYAWASGHILPGDEDKDPPLREPRAYAAAALLRLTGDAKYAEQFKTDTAALKVDAPLWNDTRYGPMIYCLGAEAGEIKADAAVLARLRAALLSSANMESVDAAGKRALRWGGDWYMPMLIGQQTTPWVLESAVGYALTRKSDPEKAKVYLQTLYTTADYFLGTNALNMTFITGVGPRHPNNVFHMDAWYNGKGAFHEGIIPYGQWRKEKDLGDGPWDVAWAHKTVYPPIDVWPGNERFFDNRCSPMGSEFTIHQNIGPAAAIFGILCAPGPAATAAK